VALTLETLLINFEADMTAFDAALDEAVEKARKAGQKIEQMKISPSVDLSDLHALNKVIDSKIKHIGQLQKVAQKGINVEASMSMDGADSISGAIEQGLKNALDGLGDVAAAPLKSVFTGLFEGLGNEITKRFASGFFGQLKKVSGKSLEAIGASSINQIVKPSRQAKTQEEPRSRRNPDTVMPLPPLVAKPRSREMELVELNRAKQMVNLATTAIPSNPEAIAVKSGEAIFEAQGSQLKQTLKEIKGNAAKSVDVALEQIKKIGSSFAQIEKELQSLQGANLRKFAQYAKESVDQAYSEIERLSQMIPKEYNRKVGYQKGRITKAKNKIDTVINAPVQSESIGFDVSKGVAQGIEKSQKQAETAAKKLAQSIEKAAKDELEIQSPSKKFEKIGMFIIQGLKVGLSPLGSILGLIISDIDSSVKEAEAIKRLGRVDSSDQGIARKQRILQLQAKKRPEISGQILKDLEVAQIEKAARTKPSRITNQREEVDRRIKAREERRIRAIEQAERKELAELLLDKKRQRSLRGMLEDPRQAIARIRGVTQDDKRIEELDRKYIPIGSEKFFLNMFGQGAEVFRKKVFGQMPKAEGRAMTREVVGMGFAAASMANPVLTALAGLAPLAMSLAPTAIALAGVANMLKGIWQNGGQRVQAIESFESRLRVTAPGGDAKAVEQEYQYLKALADKYKLSLSAVAEGYTQIANASKGTKLEGQPVKDLFEGISASIKALRLNAEDSKLILMAYTQLISKGRISMEELRQQLGERFAPAMQIFAKALNTSVPEMIQLIEKGALLSEDVMPKVAKVLQDEYGAAALKGTSDLTSALARGETALFDFDRKFTEAFGGIMATFTNFGVGFIEMFNRVFSAGAQLVGAFSIGVAAQVAVGLQTILSSPAIAPKAAVVQNFMQASFRAGLATLSPFLIGVFADIMSDIFGAKNSIFDNMSKGVTNMFVGAFSVLDEVVRGFQGFDKGLFSADWSAQESANKGLLRSFVDLFQSIPSGLVEITALMLMFEQVTILGKLYLMPTLTNIGSALKSMAGSIVNAFGSGGSIKNIFRTLIADSFQAGKAIATLTGLFTKFALAYTVISFAASDFSNPIMDAINRTQKAMITSIQSIRKELLSLSKTEITIKAKQSTELASKGLELNPLEILFRTGENSFKVDDLKKLFNPKGGEIRGDAEIRQFASIKDQANRLGIGQFFSGQERYLTTAQRQLLGNASTIESQYAKLYSNLYDNGLIAGIPFESLLKKIEPVTKELESLDKQIGKLAQERVNLGLDNTTDAKVKIREIDKEINSLLNTRKTAKKPIEDILGDFSEIENALRKQIEAIDKSDLPDAAKRALKRILDPQIKIIEQTRAAIKSAGLEQLLTPLEKTWQKTIDTLKDAEKQAAKTAHAIELTTTQNQINIAKNINPLNQTQTLIALQQEELRDVRSRDQDLRVNANIRKIALQDLLSIPEVERTEDRANEIEDLRDKVRQDERDLASSQLRTIQLENDIARSRRQQANELKEFINQQRDFTMAVEDYQINLRDTAESIERVKIDFLDNAAKEVRGFREQYTDLMFSLTVTFEQINLEIKSTQKQAENLRTKLSLSEGLGDNSLAKGINEIIFALNEDMAQLSKERDGLTLSQEEETQKYLQTLRQLRDTEEAIALARNNRARTEIDLFRQQEAVERDQIKSAIGLREQFVQLTRRSEELGVALEEVKGATKAIANNQTLPLPVSSLLDPPRVSPPPPAGFQPQAVAPNRGLNNNYARLSDLERSLKQNRQFATDEVATQVALIIAAGEAGSPYLRRGSGSDLFNFRGGAGNNMQGFAQFNRKYFAGQTATPEFYKEFLGGILTGRLNLPTGRGRFNPRDLEKAVKNGVIRTEEQLLKYLQARIPIMDWHGLHESGGGARRIRESGVLGRALNAIAGNRGNTAPKGELLANATLRIGDKKAATVAQPRQVIAPPVKPPVQIAAPPRPATKPRSHPKPSVPKSVVPPRMLHEIEGNIFPSPQEMRRLMGEAIPELKQDSKRTKLIVEIQQQTRPLALPTAAQVESMQPTALPSLNFGAGRNAALQNLQASDALTRERMAVNELKQQEALLRAEQSLRSLTVEREKTAREQIKSIRDQVEAAQDLILEGKGYLTVSEEQYGLARDVKRQYDDQIEQLQEQKRLIEEQTELTLENLPQQEAILRNQGVAQEAIAAAMDAQRQSVAALTGQIQGIDNAIANLNQTRDRAAQAALARDTRERQREVLRDANDLTAELLQKESEITGNIFKQIRLRQDAARLEIGGEFGDRRFDLRKRLDRREIDPVTFTNISANLDRLEQINLSQAFIDANPFAQAFSDLLLSTVDSASQSFKNMGEVGLNALRQIGMMLAKLAIQMIAMKIFGIGGGGGLNFSGAFGGTGFSGGGFAGGAYTSVGASTIAFKYGGAVPNFSYGGDVAGLGAMVVRAMAREGAGAVPIVAHKGEQILSDLNGDAQLFRALQRNGEWRNIKQSYGVQNYNYGGMVGGDRTSNTSSPRGNTTRGDVHYHATYNISTPNPDAFRKSQDQITREKEQRSRRSAERNG
jgi:tape measure domain-containing protein